MRPRSVRCSLLAVAWLLLMAPGPGNSQQPREAKTAVLVELFTSEGCSSCLQADRLLTELQEQPAPGVEIITLGEHVDYWDPLGWQDRFASQQFTRRQQDYGIHFNQSDVYTPQMIVDGEEEFVAKDAGETRLAIQRAAARAKARLRIETGAADENTGHPRWTIHVDSLPPRAPAKVDVFIAITESDLSSEVARGENRGRSLRHSSVVRILRKIGEVENGPAVKFEQAIQLRLDPAWNRQNLRIVAFLQEAGPARVIGAASLPVAAN